MQLNLIIKQSIRHLLSRWQSCFVVLFSLSICTASVLIISEGVLYSSTFLTDIETNKRTYNLNMPSYYEDTTIGYDFVDTILYANTLPEIATIFDIQAAPIINENVELYICPKVYVEGNERYNTSVKISEGRSFSNEEICNGENVIVLGLDTDVNVGETISINEEIYTVIGKSDSLDSFLTYKNVKKNNKFVLSVGSIEFSHILTEEESNFFLKIARISQCDPVTYYSEYLGDFIVRTILYFIIMLFVLFCAANIISGLFKYMAESRKYEFSIYIVLGIQRKAMILFFYFPIVLLSIISFVIGLLLYLFTKPIQAYLGFENLLNYPIILIVFVVVTVMLFFTVFPLFKKVEKSNPTESW